MASRTPLPRSPKDRRPRHTSSVEFVQPLSLAAGRARARQQRRARRLALLLRLAVLVLLLGAAGGAYALLSSGETSRSELFSSAAPLDSRVLPVSQRGQHERPRAAAGRLQAARRRALAIRRRGAQAATSHGATDASIAATANPTTTTATTAATATTAGTAATATTAGTAATAGTAVTAGTAATATTATTAAATSVTTAGVSTTSGAVSADGASTTTAPSAASSTIGAAGAPAASTNATDSLTVSEAALDAAAGTLSFDPPTYLMPFYKSLARQYGISWRLLAALSYVQSGGYGHVLAGASSAPMAAAERASAAGNTRALNVNVIAQAASAAAQPRPELYSDARQLAASGAALTPGAAVQSVTDDYSTTDAVLTIAQEIGELPATTPATATETPTTTGTTTATDTAATAGDTRTAGGTATATDTAAPTAMQAERISAMLGEASLLNGLPYVWGGGHDNPAWLVNSGFDCSGFVSAVLHAAGYLDSPQTTQTLPGSAGILSGPGQYVTIYDRTVNTMTFATPKKKKPKPPTSENISITQATTGVHLTSGEHSDSLQMTPAAIKAIEAAAIQKGNEQDNTINDEHVIIDIDGHYWESGGDSPDGGGDSVHPIASISQSYLKSFNMVLHPAGL